MEVEIFEGSQVEWDEYVLNNPSATIYNLYSWGIFFKNIYKLKPIYLSVVNENKIIGVSLLILMRDYRCKNILVSLPYFCTGGIVADNFEAELLLLEKIKDLKSSYKCNYSLLKLGDINEGFNYGNIDKQKKSFLLSLEKNHEKVFNRFDKQIRRRIRKGYKSGCQVDISNKYIENFYDIYRINMRLLGSPVHKKSFYTGILDQFPDNYTVLVVLKSGKVIGAQLLSYFNKTVYLPLASSLREYNDHSPNHLLYWESIKYGCDNGYDYCDFGRSTVGSGPYVFKKQWNAEEVPLNYCFYRSKNTDNYDGNSYSKLQLASDLWKKMPLQVTNFLGPHISKWLP